ncbi:hypothetical protein [Flammeovirga aprica]|uniref:Uncharacterized protein n=1 Tax=Flammeovirga aprica JL-4 TaxID=694437 RepID=A0A7X9S1Z5_9BACT|nr:hypothetical protein [Flammeovirga aprica]NME72816.1 hypothetical protein [Flammeovirga aprica JL-4]
MNNLFNAQRFSRYITLELNNQKQLFLYGIGAVVSFIFVALFLIRATNDSPITNDDLFGLFIFAYIVVATAVVNRSFLPFRSPKKLITFLTFPVSHFEKFLFEYMSTVLVGVFIVPFLILFTYMVEGEIHQTFNENINYTGLTFITNVIEDTLVNGSEDKLYLRQMGILMVFLLPWSIMNVMFTGNSVFTKWPLIKSVLSVTAYFIFHGLLVFLIFEKMGVQEYVSNDHPLFFFSDSSSAIHFVLFSMLLANVVFVYCSYLKLKEKEL